MNQNDSPLTGGPFLRIGLTGSPRFMNDKHTASFQGCARRSIADPQPLGLGDENGIAASFTVFVCSTLSDLSQEREGVLDAIRRLKLQHDSMEFFGARADQPIETCLQEVRASDVLVVIVGHRYGSIVPEFGISYSEAEYRRVSAQEALPRLYAG